MSAAMTAWALVQGGLAILFLDTSPAGEALNEGVIHWLVGVGAAGAVAGGGAVDDICLARLDRFVAETQALHDAGAIAFDEHVCGVDQ